MQTNPAISVRGPKHVVRKGKTPILDAAEVRLLLDSIGATSHIDLRDKALIALMLYSFARIGAVVAMKVTAITDRNLNAAGGVLRLDSRLLCLGDAAVIVHNLGQFQQRLEAGIHANSFLQSHAGQNGRASGVVEYVDFKNHHGDLGPFRKSEDFKFQHEWRLALIDSREEQREDHIFLEIGDLSDIVSVMESATLLANEIRAEPR